MGVKPFLAMIPADLHFKLKLYALNNNTSMTSIVISCIQEELSKFQTEHGENNEKNNENVTGCDR